MIKSRNPRFREYVQLKIDRNEFMRTLGFRITLIEAGKVEGELPFLKIHEQQNGYFHGGVISSLCDMACGYAAYSLAEEGAQVFTVEMKVSYLRKGIGERLLAKGAVIKAGNNFHFCEAEIFAENKSEQKLIAKASATMAIVREKVNDKYGD
ncbi:MAG TPA: PaaI family thioesterase [Chitinophagales bacterium]|nr:PaaI family thioesterase [Chitinophagales bacterium]